MSARLIKPVAISPAINVTPLIDVVLVLLIIFMVITPLLHDDITVQIPDLEQVETVDEVPPDQLLVHVTRAGVLELNGAAVTRADLEQTLRARLAEQRASLVFVAADGEASYELVVHTLDSARRAGAKTLGLSTAPPTLKEP